MYMMIKQTGHSTEANDCVQQKNSNSTEHIKSKYMHLVKTKYIRPIPFHHPCLHESYTYQ